MTYVLGLANGTVPLEPLELTPGLAEGWAAEGIGCIAVPFGNKTIPLSPRVRVGLRSMLADHGIRIAQFAGVNANLAHREQAIRQAGIERVRAAIPAALDMGAQMIISGVGTSHEEWEADHYAPHPANHEPEAEEWLVEALRQVAKLIEGTDLLYALECHQLTTARSPQAIRRILDAVDSPQVVANFDPVNLLDSAYAAHHNAEVIPNMVETVGPRYGPTCHIKDIAVRRGFVCHLDECPLGHGLVDLDAVFTAVQRLPKPTALIVEHLTAEQTVPAVRHVRAAATAFGLEFAN